MSVDYRALKQRIGLRQILDHIGWKHIEGRGDQLRGPCPLPGCSCENACPSDRRHRTFSVHEGKNVYRCFGCQSTGTVLDFWQAYRQIPLHAAAIELQRYAETSNSTWLRNQPENSQLASSQSAKLADS